MVCVVIGMFGSRLVREQSGAKPKIVVHRLAAPRLPPGDIVGAGRDVDLPRVRFFNGIN